MYRLVRSFLTVLVWAASLGVVVGVPYAQDERSLEDRISGRQKELDRIRKEINEHRQYSPYYGGWWGYGRGRAMSQNVAQEAGAPAGDIADTIALGKISIRGSVTVVFTLK